MSNSGHEEWRSIEGFQAYEVSDRGNVRRISPRPFLGGRGRPSKFCPGGPLKPNRSGRYLHVVLLPGDGTRKTRSVHRLVAEAFISPRPPNSQVHHLNGDSVDNRAENLAFVSLDQHARAEAEERNNGPSHARPPRILTIDQAIAIRRLRASGLSYIQLATMFPVSRQQASRIARGAQWTWLRDSLPTPSEKEGRDEDS